jgi:hypothetical protein
VAKIPAAVIGFRIPIVGNLNQWRLIAMSSFDIIGGSEENERKSSGLAVVPIYLYQPQLVAKEVEGAV